MAKLRTDPIQVSDLRAFIAAESDFSFELEIYRLLKDLDLACSHGGSYDDPITDKPREFDLRAELTSEGIYGQYRVRFCLPIECKNVREYYPILALCVPRSKKDAYNEFMQTSENNLHLMKAEGVYVHATNEGNPLAKA